MGKAKANEKTTPARKQPDPRVMATAIEIVNHLGGKADCYAMRDMWWCAGCDTSNCQAHDVAKIITERLRGVEI